MAQICLRHALSYFLVALSRITITLSSTYSLDSSIFYSNNLGDWIICVIFAHI